MGAASNLQLANRRTAGRRWPSIQNDVLRLLDNYSRQHELSVADGDLTFLDHGWYITHTGLLRIAKKNGCFGIQVSLVNELSDNVQNRFVFQAVVFTSRISKGFSGYGDADPSNVSPAMHGAELRIAETRAVNRALRKAYGIGLCSVEELGSSPAPPSNGSAKKAPVRVNANLEVIAAVPLRDQLRQIIRQHKLDPVLTKSYALEHLQLKSLRDATREQVRELVEHLQKRLFEDRDRLVEDLAKLSTTESGKEVA